MMWWDAVHVEGAENERVCGERMEYVKKVILM